MYVWSIALHTSLEVGGEIVRNRMKEVKDEKRPERF
jgi:hypothetical protein